MASGGKSRRRSHRKEGEEEEEDEEEEDEKGVAKRRSGKHRQSEREGSKRGHKRKDSSGGDRSSKKMRSGEKGDGVVAGAGDGKLGDSEKKGRKVSRAGRDGDEATEKKGRKLHRGGDDGEKKEKVRKSSRGDDYEESTKKKGGDGDEDLEIDRYRYNCEDDEQQYASKSKKKEKDDRDDRKKRDRDEKHSRDERSKRSATDRGERTSGSRKKHREDEDDSREKRTGKDVDGHRKKPRDDEDEYCRKKKTSKDEQDRPKELADSYSRKESEQVDKKRKDDSPQKDSKHRIRDDRHERRSRAPDRDPHEEKDEGCHRSHDEEHGLNGGERHAAKKLTTGDTDRKEDDEFRSGENGSRVSSNEAHKDGDRHDDHYPRRSDRREPSRDRSYEDDYWRRPRHERDDRSRQYRGYKEHRDDDRPRRGSARPDDYYSRRGGSYRIPDGADRSWSWRDSFFPPFAPHYGAGGFLDHFPASVYGMRSMGLAYPPARFMRGPAGFVGEDGYLHPWYRVQSAGSGAEESKAKLLRSPVDEHDEQEREHVSQGSLAPEKPCDEPEASVRPSLRDVRIAEEKRQLLSSLSVSEELAGPDVYRQYLARLAEENIEPPKLVEMDAAPPAAVASPDSDDDRVLEADREGEDLLRTLDGEDVTSNSEDSFFSAQLEAALKLCRRPDEEKHTQESLVGWYTIPRECVTVLQSGACPSRGFLETATREEGGEGCSTGRSDAMALEDEEEEEKEAEDDGDEGAGGALKVVAGINGGGDFSAGKETTLVVAVEAEAEADEDDNSRDPEGGPDDKRRLDGYETAMSSGGDGDDRVRDRAGALDRSSESSRRVCEKQGARTGNAESSWEMGKSDAVETRMDDVGDETGPMALEENAGAEVKSRGGERKLDSGDGSKDGDEAERKNELDARHAVAAGNEKTEEDDTCRDEDPEARDSARCHGLMVTTTNGDLQTKTRASSNGGKVAPWKVKLCYSLFFFP